MQSEDLHVSFGTQRYGKSHGFHLLRKRLKFGLLVLDLAAHFVEFIGDLNRVLYRFRLLQDSEILRLLCAQISQARSVVHVLLGDILRFHLFAFHAQSKLADFRPDLFKTSSWYANR